MRKILRKLFYVSVLLCISITVNAQSYFYHSYGNDPWTMLRRDSDGSNPITVYTPTLEFVYHVAADASVSNLYFYDSNTGSDVPVIYNSDLDGSNSSEFLNGTEIQSLGAGSGFVYYALSNDPWELVRRDSDGSNLATIYIPPKDFVDYVAVDPGISKLYFIDGDIGGGNTVLYQSDLDGSNRTAILENLPAVTSMTAGAGYVFYAISDDPWTVIRVDSDGTNSTTIYTPPVDYVRHLAYNPIVNKLFFYDPNIGSSKRVIYSCDADGSNRTAVVDGVGNDIMALGTINGSSSAPEIDILGNGNSIADGDGTPSTSDHTDFGSTDISSGTITRTFTIENTGSADLNLTGSSPYVSIGGSHAVDFSVSSAPSSVISSSSSTTFQITFDPSAIGIRTANISIANNDSDEDPYNYSIQGSGYTSPTATTESGSALTSTGATLNGTINANNSSTSVTFEYGPDTNYGNSVTADQSPVSGTTDTPVSYDLSGLSSNATYHYRVVGSNSGGTSNGSDQTFTTLAEAPAVTTEAVSSVTSTTATGNGTITDLGAPDPTAHGVCWNTSGTPTVSENSTDEGSASSTGAFTSGITSLTPNTTYYIRAYAINSVGTVYGGEVTFTTSGKAPETTTEMATGVTVSSATLKGSINPYNDETTVTFEYGKGSDYGSDITADQSPVKGVSETTVSVELSNLDANTAYHYRLVGSNAIGTSYGEDQSFTTEKYEQEITFPSLPEKSINDDDFDPGATSNRGLPITYSSSNGQVATIENGMIHIVEAGTTDITASQQGNDTVYAATPIMRTLDVSEATGAVYTKLSNVKIYPNPVSNTLHIEIDEETMSGDYKVTITNMDGKQVFYENFEGRYYQVNVEPFGSGYYLLELQTANRTKQLKIWVK